MNIYQVSIQSNQDIYVLDIDEREELEEKIDDEITEAQEQIEIWCNEYKADYDLFENHRCIVTINSLYANEIFTSTLKAIEDNLLDETYISYEEIEE